MKTKTTYTEEEKKLIQDCFLKVGLQVRKAIELIKEGLSNGVLIERYDIDKKFDVHIEVKLKPKKSQYQLMIEIFRGKK